MKKTIFFTVVCSIMLASCGEDFLSRNPKSELNVEGFYQTQTDMNQATLAAYAKLRDLYGSTLITLGEIRSDNTTYSWLAGNPVDERGIDEFKEPLLENNGNLSSLWNNAYNLILRCNLVIKYVETASFNEERYRTQYEAEVRFLRALMYFWLNRAFGGTATNGQLLGVCKVETLITQNEAYEIGRAPLEEIYALIVEDLTYAQANLPKSYASADRGRVIQAGAAAMLAKVYMFMAGFPLNKGNEYYTKAIQQMEYVFNTYPEVQLAPTYQHLFSSPHNQSLYTKNSVESLFEIQYKKGAPSGRTGSPWNNNFAPRFSDKEVAQVGDKSGTNAPTVDMSNAYEYGDPRKYVSMRDGWRSANTGAWENDKYVCKYYDVSTSGSDNDNNWIELRLADIYLLYSEALVRVGGDKGKALEYLNKIRQRARNTPGNPEITDAPATLLRDYTLADFASDEAFLLAIEKERRVELAFENHRWGDLVRTGRAKDVMIAQQFAEVGQFTWDDKQLMYPIPETVMQSNPGNIIQNRGYTQL